jgi:hypothetical protein
MAPSPRGTGSAEPWTEIATMTNFVIYMIGVVLAVGALAYGAHRAGVSEPWIWIGVVALIGLGVMGGIVKTRGRGG